MPCLQTVAMTQTRLSSRPSPPGCKLLFRPRRTARYSANTIDIFTSFVIWLKTPSCTSNAGVVLLPAMLRTPLHSLLQFKFVVSLSGLLFLLDYCRHDLLPFAPNPYNPNQPRRLVAVGDGFGLLLYFEYDFFSNGMKQRPEFKP